MNAEQILKALVDFRDTEIASAKGGASYESLRKLRRDGEAMWKAARELVYGPEQVDNRPKGQAEAERWKAREARIAASRAMIDAPTEPKRRGRPPKAVEPPQAA